MTFRNRLLDRIDVRYYCSVVSFIVIPIDVSKLFFNESIVLLKKKNNNVFKRNILYYIVQKDYLQNYIISTCNIIYQNIIMYKYTKPYMP